LVNNQHHFPFGERWCFLFVFSSGIELTPNSRCGNVYLSVQMAVKSENIRQFVAIFLGGNFMNTRKLNDSVSPVIMIVIAVVIAAIIATISLMVANLMKERANAVTDQLNQMGDAALESRYTDYIDRELTGTEVKACLKNWKEDAGLTVSVGSTSFINDGAAVSTSYKEMNIKGKSSYINPSGKFFGEIIKSDDGKVTITFTQETTSSSAP